MAHFVYISYSHDGRPLAVNVLNAPVQVRAITVTPYVFETDEQARSYRDQLLTAHSLPLPVTPEHMARGKRKQVRCFQTQQTFPSASAAARAFGVTTSAITKHLRNPYVNKTVKGYTFEYVTDLT